MASIPASKLSNTMNKFFDDLRIAEFESGDYNDESDPRKMVKLLKRALSWKSHKNLEAVCEYLGAECDDRCESIEGCKEIIQEDIDYWKNQ